MLPLTERVTVVSYAHIYRGQCHGPITQMRAVILFPHQTEDHLATSAADVAIQKAECLSLLCVNPRKWNCHGQIRILGDKLVTCWEMILLIANILI